MAYTRTTLGVTTASGVFVQHGLIQQDDPRGLVMLLPGGFYPVDAPVLYFPRMVAADLGYDTLSIHYAYQQAPDRAEAYGLEAEIDLALDGLLQQRRYPKLVVIGKSLGTPLAVQLTRQRPVDGLILLTPIDTAVQDAGSLPTLAVIGTRDPVYDAEQIALTRERPNIRWLIIEGADHGLQVAGDHAAMLNGLGQVMQACEEFLR